jgi:phosphatidylinositol glycan class A protein
MANKRKGRKKPPPLDLFSSIRQSSSSSSLHHRHASSPRKHLGNTATPNAHRKPKHTILMVSDFFFPRLGGVEMHIWSLSQCLLSQGHKVVVLTRQYDDRKGIRWMTNGLKVYYLPGLIVGDAVTLPTNMFHFPMFRQICIRENISIVHCHQATAMLGQMCILHAGTMGLPCVYTDHSLFSFNELLPILLGLLMTFTLQGANHCIAVSHTCRENLCMRAHLNPKDVSTIPNAIDPKLFVPDLSRRGDGLTVGERVNIVILSRLVFRKGIQIAVRVIPKICAKFPNVYFIVGGDGNLKLLMLEMIEQNRLFDRKCLGHEKNKKFGPWWVVFGGGRAGC